MASFWVDLFFVLLALLFTADLLWAFALLLLPERLRELPEPEAPLPPISLIVCFHNEAEHIPALLPLLAGQQGMEYECILVDDRSTDATPGLLQAAAYEHQHVRYLRINTTPEGWAPKKWALSQGIDTATHTHLAFTDADCRPGPHWLASLAAYFLPRYTGAPAKELVIGLSLFEQQPGYLNRYLRWEALTTALRYVTLTQLGLPTMAVGRNLAYTKAFYQRAGGFASHAVTLSGDDDLLVAHHARSKHTALALSPPSRVPSTPVQSWPAYYHQRARHLGASKHYPWHKKAVLAFLAGIPLWWAGTLGLAWALLPAFALSVALLALLTSAVLNWAALLRAAAHLGQAGAAWLHPWARLVAPLRTLKLLIKGTPTTWHKH